MSVQNFSSLAGLDITEKFDLIYFFGWLGGWLAGKVELRLTSALVWVEVEFTISTSIWVDLNLLELSWGSKFKRFRLGGWVAGLSGNIDHLNLSLSWIELSWGWAWQLKKTKNRTFKADFGITLNKAEIVKTLDYTLFRSASSCRNRTCEKKGNKLGLSWAKLSSSWD